MEEAVYIIFRECGQYTSYNKYVVQVLKNREDALKELEKYKLKLEQYKGYDESYFIEKFIIGTNYDYDISYPNRIE